MKIIVYIDSEVKSSIYIDIETVNSLEYRIIALPLAKALEKPDSIPSEAWTLPVIIAKEVYTESIVKILEEAAKTNRTAIEILQAITSVKPELEEAVTDTQVKRKLVGLKERLAMLIRKLSPF